MQSNVIHRPSSREVGITKAPGTSLLRHASPRSKPFRVTRCSARASASKSDEDLDRRTFLFGCTAAASAASFPLPSAAEGEVGESALHFTDILHALRHLKRQMSQEGCDIDIQWKILRWSTITIRDYCCAAKVLYGLASPPTRYVRTLQSISGCWFWLNARGLCIERGNQCKIHTVDSTLEMLCKMTLRRSISTIGTLI